MESTNSSPGADAWVFYLRVGGKYANPMFETKLLPDGSRVRYDKEGTSPNLFDLIIRTAEDHRGKCTHVFNTAIVQSAIARCEKLLLTDMDGTGIVGTIDSVDAGASPDEEHPLPMLLDFENKYAKRRTVSVRMSDVRRVTRLNLNRLYAIRRRTDQHVPLGDFMAHSRQANVTAFLPEGENL